MPLTDADDALRLLQTLGAPERLLRHARLVGEAADALLQTYRRVGVAVDARRVTVGAALHDAGKIAYPDELDAPGHQHEAAGQTLLLDAGVAPEIALCCVTHRAWQGADVSLEERTVALADKLWKGKRDEALELSVVDGVAERRGVGRWDVYVALDTAFEAIAAAGDARLSRSRAG